MMGHKVYRWMRNPDDPVPVDPCWPVLWELPASRAAHPKAGLRRFWKNMQTRRERRKGKGACVLWG